MVKINAMNTKCVKGFRLHFIHTQFISFISTKSIFLFSCDKKPVANVERRKHANKKQLLLLSNAKIL